MKRILAFGISGFTGSYFAGFVRKANTHSDYLLIGADRVAPKKTIEGMAEFVLANATDKRSVRSAFRRTRPDYVVNFAGTFSAKRFEDYMKLNVDTTRQILEAASESDYTIQKILLIGSAAEYGMVARNPVSEHDPTNPVTLYGLSKVMQTHLCRYYYRVHSLSTVVARAFNILGEGLSESLSIGSFQQQIRHAADGGSIRVGNIDTIRDYLPIESVVSLYWTLLQHGRPGEIYNVCSGTGSKISDILNEMIAASGKRLFIERDTTRIKSNDVPSLYGDRTKLDKLIEEFGDS
jgi:GDP-4-dehydro-6-deoxy-D-mannose reductase